MFRVPLVHHQQGAVEQNMRHAVLSSPLVGTVVRSAMYDIQWRIRNVRNNWSTLQAISFSIYCVGCKFASIHHTLLISPQLCTLEMIVLPSDPFVQMHFLMVEHLDPKQVRIL